MSGGVCPQVSPRYGSDVELVLGQAVHEGLDQEVCGEVEDQAEGDGDG